MISKLTIKNFIIIEEVEVDFSANLNIFVGETGAGKSIIMQAFMLLFGEKGTANLVRQDANKAVIEGSFDMSVSTNNRNETIIASIKEIIDIEIENELIIRREIPLKGNSRCFINDTPVPLNVLKQISSMLVDFHGQNEQSKILDNSFQLSILDALMQKNELNIFHSYQTNYDIFIKQINNYNSLLNKYNSSEFEIDRLQKLIKEIETLNPKPDEDTQINNELKLLENSEYIASVVEKFINILDNNDTSVVNGLIEAGKTLKELQNIDSNFTQYRDEFRTAYVSINEALKHAKEYKNNISYQPAKIERLRSRYSDLRKLVKKYGSIEDALLQKEQMCKELDDFKNYDGLLIQMKNEIHRTRNLLSDLSCKLHIARTASANVLENKLVIELENLGMVDAKFEAKIDINLCYDKQRDKTELTEESAYSIWPEKQIVELTSSGADSVEFYISTNKGEKLSPLSNTASGGEVSRIMLAIKSILANNDKTPILIFDEIDTGISGRIAQKTGKAIRELANYHQVIAITHLPQIAALGKHFILIEKTEINDRVVSQAKVIKNEDRIYEIARMLSGEKITDAAMKQAKELIEN